MRLIDADELKKAFAEYGEKAKFLQDFCQKLIDNAPTVEAIPTELHEKIMDKVEGELLECQSHLRPQGEWGEPFSHGDRLYHKCSNCHVSTQIIFDNYFCPNCGADMRGEKK